MCACVLPFCCVYRVLCPVCCVQAVSETTAAPLVSISLSLKVSLQLWGFTSPLRDSATFVLPNGLSKYTGSTCKFEYVVLREGGGRGEGTEGYGSSGAALVRGHPLWSPCGHGGLGGLHWGMATGADVLHR
jgi:hypothetical protein